MKRATLIATDDLNWKNGFVQCVCGWRKELGNGFNGYHIDVCPSCTPELETRTQRTVTTGNPRRGFKVEIGRFVYFVIDNGIHIQYDAIVNQTYDGLSEQQVDAITV